MPAIGFNANRLKVQLRLAINRLKLLQQKKESINKQARKELAQLLEKGKYESARIRVEHVIREDYLVEALEALELYCELLLARFGLIETMSHCDTGIYEAVCTIIYAAPRSEVKELSMVREQLIAKYGKEFTLAAMECRHDCVNPRVVQKFKIQTPAPVLVNQYLKEIANCYNVQWEGDVEGIDSALGITAASVESPNVKIDSSGNYYYDAAPTAPSNLEQLSPHSQQQLPAYPILEANLQPCSHPSVAPVHLGTAQQDNSGAGVPLDYSEATFDFQRPGQGQVFQIPGLPPLPPVPMPQFPIHPDQVNTSMQYQCPPASSQIQNIPRLGPDGNTSPGSKNEKPQQIFSTKTDASQTCNSSPSPKFPAIPTSLPKENEAKEDMENDGSAVGSTDGTGNGGCEPDFEELTKRFEALKKGIRKK